MTGLSTSWSLRLRIWEPISMLIPLYLTITTSESIRLIAYGISAKILSTTQSHLTLMSLPLLIYYLISFKILGSIRTQLNGKGT